MSKEIVNPAAASAEAAPKPRVTYEQFLSRDNGAAGTEWVDGEVIAMPPISIAHQKVTKFLLHLIDGFVEAHHLGEVQYEPFPMKTGPDLPGRSPDILFVAAAHLDRLHENLLEGPADLVVEVISPQSGHRDRGEKFYEYEEGGVGEYWLIDPQRRQAEFYIRDSDGIFRPVPSDADGIFRSTLLPRLLG